MTEDNKKTQLRDTAEWLVETAVKMGASTAEAHMNHSRDFELEVRGSEIENLSEAESHGASITVSRDGKRASVQSSDTERNHLRTLIEKAMYLCEYTDKDDSFSLPPVDRLAREPQDLDLFDQRLAVLSVDDKFRLAQRAEKQMMAHNNRIISNGSSFSDTISTSAMASSQGFSASIQATIAGMGVSGFANDDVVDGDLNTGRKQSGGWSQQTRFFDMFDSPESLGERAAIDILRLLGAKKPHTGKYPVYFEPATARTLWRHLLSAMTGSHIYRDESFLAGKVGEQVTSDNVTIIDDPLIPRALASHPYDDEGVACARRDLIDAGVLNTYLLSTYSANKLGLQTTGHAGGTGNILIKPGDQSEDQLIKSIDKGVWITGLSGQGVNVATGDYSRGAEGLWIEKGQVCYPIMEFTINSNLKTMFQHIAAVASEPELGWSVVTPGLLIDEMSVSGV